MPCGSGSRHCRIFFMFCDLKSLLKGLYHKRETVGTCWSGSAKFWMSGSGSNNPDLHHCVNINTECKPVQILHTFKFNYSQANYLFLTNVQAVEEYFMLIKFSSLKIKQFWLYNENCPETLTRTKHEPKPQAEGTRPQYSPPSSSWYLPVPILLHKIFETRVKIMRRTLPRPP